MIIKLSVGLIVIFYLTSCVARSRLSVWMDEKQVEHMVGEYNFQLLLFLGRIESMIFQVHEGNGGERFGIFTDDRLG